MESKTDEIKRLERCINDLVSVLALPAIWTGHESSLVATTLLDVLLQMLCLVDHRVRRDEHVFRQKAFCVRKEHG